MKGTGRALARRAEDSPEPSVRIAAKLARLQLIGLDQWLAIEQIVDYCLERSEANRMRRYHGRPPMLRMDLLKDKEMT